MDTHGRRRRQSRVDDAPDCMTQHHSCPAFNHSESRSTPSASQCTTSIFSFIAATILSIAVQCLCASTIASNRTHPLAQPHDLNERQDAEQILIRPCPVPTRVSRSSGSKAPVAFEIHGVMVRLRPRFSQLWQHRHQQQ